MTQYSKLFLSLLLLTVLIITFVTMGLSGTPVNNPVNTKESIKSIKGNLNPVVNPASTYKKVCGQCHMPYPPEFLPSGSWEKLLGSTEKHFGGTLEIDHKTKGMIAPYLKENSAESSKSRISQKIMQSLDGITPLRLTEVPYILKKHRKISSDVFQKRSIGSFANCKACHPSADKWIFDKKVIIPE